MARGITVAFAQFPVGLDVNLNLEALLRLLCNAPPNSLVITPEAGVSGYAPGPGFPENLDEGAIAYAIDRVHAAAASRGQCVIVGACVTRDDGWRNAAILLRPDGTRAEYWKVNLAHAERGAFRAGNELPVFDVALAGVSFTVGVQLCREIRYPEQWRHLAVSGSTVIAFLNNAVGDAAVAPVWRSHLVSRAAELQRFIVGCNNAAPDQKCPSIILGPDGQALAETLSSDEALCEAVIDLDRVSDWVIDQSRSDIAFRR